MSEPEVTPLGPGAAGAGLGVAAGAGELAAVGLSGAEEAAYELVVDRPAAGLPELLTGWNRVDSLSGALGSLEAKGLVVRAADAPERFEAVAPDVVLEALLVAAEAQLHEGREQARQLAELYREHILEPGRNVVELVSGRRALQQRVAQVQRATREELRCLDRPPYVDSSGTAATELELLTRGVAIRTVYDRSAVEHPGALADIERLADAGGRGRVLPSVPMKLYLADDRLALLPLQRQPAEIEAALVVHPSGLLDALVNLFEGLWQRALPLGLPVLPPGVAGVPVEPLGRPARSVAAAGRGRAAAADQTDRQRLITLLLSGLTDQAVARQLGIGHRTAQRRIASLMEELGASTRFQAGVQAALRAAGRLDGHRPGS